MPIKSRTELLNAEVGGNTLAQWNARWEPLQGGFLKERPELRAYVGLARAVQNGEIKYVLRGTEHGKGGIEKSLVRIRGPEQSGNKGFGARQIRAHSNELELEVLKVGQDFEAAELTKKLKKLFVKLDDPEWNRPHIRRMKALRDAKKALKGKR